MNTVMDVPQGVLQGGYYVVDIYRGSDTTDVEGISWWTTDRATAGVYASRYGSKGIIMQRTVQLPVMRGHICSPNSYLLGGRHLDRQFNTVDTTDLTHYYYGLHRGDVPLNRIEHFDMSIHHTILDGITLKGGDTYGYQAG